MAEQTKIRIAVVGAGIAGLATAIALKGHPGVDVQIYERASELREIGASIALGPNGMRTLDRLGVDNALSPDIAFRNKSRCPMIYRHYKTAEIVSVDTHVGKVDDDHLTSRYYRAHLQKALLEHVKPSQIHLQKSFESVEFDESRQELAITFGDGTTVSADIILGADGIHSKVRTFFVPTSRTGWTGWVTFRSAFSVSELSGIDVPEEAEHIWGPDRTLFISKLGKNLFTVVGSHQSDPNAPDAPYKDAVWNSPGDVRTLREYYKDWHPRYRDIVNATPYTHIYPNAAAHALDTWVLGNGRVTLAGDAAHAHGGAFAAGGSLALDDAWAFAAAITYVFPPEAVKARSGPVVAGKDVARALQIYEKTRKGHTDRVMAVVHEMNEKKVARLGHVQTDEDLRARMKNRYDPSWIHEHDVQAAFEQAL
ncbi:FAD/NAD(P)-binding domain-containing protein [Cryphonectria parasitica EP155]|uniref:FAD/NAD(P)-binding domain-containing protein n=1 Tax=Cryphonectria parasitica (strain ATCC 38755 / EP155) TaxID=660469 RepID=A0A9P5CTI7_CRYP1|nr:FAD/NAD(P)-binding domain-containing protein [Cryphonectria parasitica EP155]KAF3769712.1 FAD/NAD(P)-binding domain-containing protein [Cryphonectria parasitica EP155]